MKKFKISNLRFCSSREKALPFKRKPHKLPTKPAFFLSIELAIVLIILTVVVVSVAVMGEKLLNLYRANQIISNVQRLGESINQFKGSYGYYPGDMPINQLVGEFANTNLIASVQNLETYVNGWINNATIDGEGCTFNTYQVSPFWKMGTGIVGASKAMLASQQLYASGMTVKGLLYQYDYSTKAFVNIPVANGGRIYYPNFTIPNSAYGIQPYTFVYDRETGLEYQFKIDACDKFTTCHSGPFPIMYSTQYAAYPKIWSEKPRIEITRYSTTDAPTQRWPGGWFNGELGGNWHFIPPELAYTIDSKMDDGLPYGANSKVITAIDASPYSGWGGDSPLKAYLYDDKPIGTTGLIMYHLHPVAGSNNGCTTLLSVDGPNGVIANPDLRNVATPSTAVTGAINFNQIHRDSIVGGTKVLSGNTTIIQGVKYRRNKQQTFGVADTQNCGLAFVMPSV